MLSITLECEVPVDRAVTLQLPESIQPGKHELLVVIDEQIAPTPTVVSNAEVLNQLTGTLHLTEDPLAFQHRLREEWE